jgi:hypothetical protein
MAFGSRQKGATAELEVASMLQRWWREVEPGCVFKRTPSSGGWSKGDAGADFGACGDLVTSAKTFPWCVEIKRREGWAWGPLLADRPSPVWRWWGQALTAAMEARLEPILVFRHNREPWRAMLRLTEAERVADVEQLPIEHTWIRVEGDDLVLLGLGGLLSLPHPDRFARRA